MSGLGVVNAVVSRVLVGVAGPVVPARLGRCTWQRRTPFTPSAATPQICVGDNHGNGGGTDYLYLGQTNAIFADSITIGGEKATGTLAVQQPLHQSNGLFPGLGRREPVSEWNIGDASAQSTSSSSTNGTNDFSLGHGGRAGGYNERGLGPDSDRRERFRRADFRLGHDEHQYLKSAFSRRATRPAPASAGSMSAAPTPCWW